MRTALIVAYWLALLVAGVSLAYLLFIFGHTDLTSPGRVLALMVVASVSSLVVGLLHWVGLPTKDGEAPPKTIAGKKLGKK